MIKLQSIQSIQQLPIDEERKTALQPLIDYIIAQKGLHASIQLHLFTHNSRRSHLAQLWAQVAAWHYAIPTVSCYSGGTEVTAMHPNIKACLESDGFEIQGNTDAENPHYLVYYSSDSAPIPAFSKLYDDKSNPSSNFAAILTCTQADQGCPFIHGANQRILLPYEDPKRADHQPDCAEVYLKPAEGSLLKCFTCFRSINYLINYTYKTIQTNITSS